MAAVAEQISLERLCIPQAECDVVLEKQLLTFPRELISPNRGQRLFEGRAERFRRASVQKDARDSFELLFELCDRVRITGERGQLRREIARVVRLSQAAKCVQYHRPAHFFSLSPY